MMGSKSSKAEQDGVKVVGTETSETVTGGFHLLEVKHTIVIVVVWAVI